MKEKPIIAEMEEFAKKIPVYEWDRSNKDIPEKFLDFQERIRTSSDNFWYSFQNGYIEVGLITDDDDLTVADLERIEDIVDTFWFEF